MNFKYKLSDFTLKESTDFWIIVFNSFVYFMLALLTVILSSNVFTLMIGKFNDFTGKLFYYGYVIQPRDGQWSKDDVVLIFMIAPIFTLCLAVLFARLYQLIMGIKGYIKLYFLWCYILATTWFLGNIIISAISNFGMGAAFDYMGIPILVRIGVAFVVMAILFFLGRFSKNLVLISGNMYFKFFDSDNNFYVAKAQLLFPAVIGIIAYFIYRIPHHADYQFQDSLIHMTLFIFILGVFYGISQPSSTDLKKRPDWVGIDYLALGSLFIVALLIRIFLNTGFSL